MKRALRTIAPLAVRHRGLTRLLRIPRSRREPDGWIWAFGFVIWRKRAARGSVERRKLPLCSGPRPRSTEGVRSLRYIVPVDPFQTAQPVISVTLPIPHAPLTRSLATRVQCCRVQSSIKATPRHLRVAARSTETPPGRSGQERARAALSDQPRPSARPAGSTTTNAAAPCNSAPSPLAPAPAPPLPKAAPLLIRAHVFIVPKIRMDRRRPHGAVVGVVRIGRRRDRSPGKDRRVPSRSTAKTSRDRRPPGRTAIAIGVPVFQKLQTGRFEQIHAVTFGFR